MNLVALGGMTLTTHDTWFSDALRAICIIRLRSTVPGRPRRRRISQFNCKRPKRTHWFGGSGVTAVVR
jgi:hypothetical protein